MKNIKTSWDLSPLGKKYNDPAFLHEREITEKSYKKFYTKWSKNKEFLTDAKILKQALDEYNRLNELGTKEDVYLWLSSQIESQNKHISAALKKYADFAHRISDYIRFFTLELGSLDEKKQKLFLKDTSLAEYHNYLKNIFVQGRYRLSEGEEKIISMKYGVAHENWNNMLTEFLYREKRPTLIEKKEKGKNIFVIEEKGLSELLTLSSSPIKKIRESAYEQVMNIIHTHKDVAEKEINSILENKKINDLVRGYQRPDSDRHISEGIDTLVVDTLCDVVGKNWKLSHEFFKLKTHLLKQDSFDYFERNLPFGKVEKAYTYKETITIIQKAFASIDNSFLDIFNRFISEGNIDVYPKTGKRGGGFCLSHGVHDPVYVLLNFTGKTRDITTLAHEMGHAIHAVYGKKEKQINYGIPMGTAEVASTFCEDFVFDELLKNASEEERLVLLVEQLQDKTNTIFRQIAAYNFEKELHDSFRKKGYLENSEIGKIFIKHMKSYLGPRFTFEDADGLGWVSWNHFRSPFYVYSYVMGLLCAQTMRSEFKKNPDFISELKEFYSTRSSLSPVEIFEKMGMDISKADFWQQGINEYRDLLKEVKKLAQKLGKI